MEETTAAEPASVHFDNIGQIAVTVTDLARSKNFYGNVLGMKFLFDAGNMAFYQCGGVRFMIGMSDQPAPRGGTILYFRVADIHRTHAALEAQGVVFLQKPQLTAKMPDHDLWIAFLADPDQNTVGLMCEVAHGSATAQGSGGDAEWARQDAEASLSPSRSLTA